MTMNKENTTAQNMQAVNTEGIKFQRYPAYKDSGVEWLGEIPAHWGVEKLKFLSEMIVSNVDKHEKPLEIPVKLCNYVDVYKNDFITEEIDFMSATATKEEIDKFKVKIGDVLITKDSEDWQDIGVPSLVKHEAENLICGYHLAILRPKKEIIGSYLHRAMQSISAKTQLSINANGITRYGISQRAILSILLTIPPLPEQTRIATFLGRKTALIDKAIAQKERLIGLLQERRQVLIHRAVTRGLQPDVPMKDSGVEWIGEVPGHWEVRRLKYLFKEVDNRTRTGEETLFSLRMNIGLVPHEEVSDIEVTNEQLVGYKIVERGQMVMNRMRASIGLFGVSERKGLVSPDYAIFEISAEVYPDYYLQLFKTRAMGTVFRLNSKGLGTGSSGFLRLYSNYFGNIAVFVPPLKEQKAIYEYIKAMTKKLEVAINSKKEEIEKLQEFKTTLIDAAVTGKVRV